MDVGGFSCILRRCTFDWNEMSSAGVSGEWKLCKSSTVGYSFYSFKNTIWNYVSSQKMSLTSSWAEAPGERSLLMGGAMLKGLPFCDVKGIDLQCETLFLKIHLKTSINFPCLGPIRCTQKELLRGGVKFWFVGVLTHRFLYSSFKWSIRNKCIKLVCLY